MSERKYGFIVVAIIAALCAIAVLGAIAYFTWPQKPQGDVNFKQTIRVQVAPNKFYNVDIPVQAQLLQSDEESIFVYDLLTVAVVSERPALANVYTQIDDNCWVAVMSEDNWIVPSQMSMERNAVFQGYADLSKMELLTEREEYNPVIPITDVLWYPTTGGFFTYSHMYSGFEATIEEYAAKMYYLYGKTPTSYYQDETTFYIHSGDYFVGVKYVNFNTSIGVTAKGADAIDNAMSILFNP